MSYHYTTGPLKLLYNLFIQMEKSRVELSLTPTQINYTFNKVMAQLSLLTELNFGFIVNQRMFASARMSAKATVASFPHYTSIMALKMKMAMFLKRNLVTTGKFK